MARFSRRTIDISGMRDIIIRRVPVVTIDSGNPGPMFWITGCIHGNEPGGIAIVHELVKSVRKLGLKRGIIKALPLINSVGFEHGSRYINTDREDLNRCFPGDAQGSMGERFAHRLFQGVMATKPDFLIDLHNDWVQSVPYVVIEAPGMFRNKKLHKTTLAAAQATGLLSVQEADDAVEMANTLTGALVTAGVPSFVIEAGAAGAIVEKSVFAGRDAVLGVLGYFDMLETEQKAKRHPGASEVHDYTSERSMSDGLIRFLISPGDRIRENQPLAKIYSAFGSVQETLRAKCDGFVLGVTDAARATPGSDVVAIAQTD
jgi:predicted deacylase